MKDFKFDPNYILLGIAGFVTIGGKLLANRAADNIQQEKFEEEVDKRIEKKLKERGL